MLENLACNTVQMFCVFAYCHLLCMVVCHSTHRPIYLRTKNQNTHTNTWKHKNASVKNTWSPIDELSFISYFHSEYTIWFDWYRCMCCEWDLSLPLSKSHSNRLQRMPMYMQTHSIPILPFQCIYKYKLLYNTIIFILDSETITNRI